MSLLAPDLIGHPPLSAWIAERCSASGVRTGSLSSRQPPRFTLAITGRTGAYKTAHGQVRIVDLNVTDSRLTLVLGGHERSPGSEILRPTERLS